MPVAAKAKKDDFIQQYLQQEGLLALEPVYKENQGSARVHTALGIHEDPRSVKWLLKRLAHHYSVDLDSLRSHCRQILEMRSHISLPLDASLVLLPVKMRQSSSPGQTTMGFVNLLQVQEVLQPPPGKKGKDESVLSVVVFKEGRQLYTLQTPKTMRQRLHQGEQVLKDFQSRRYSEASYAGLSREVVMEHMPPCDCVFKDIAMGFLKK